MIMGEYEYLEELLGTAVANIKITVGHSDDWHEILGAKPVIMKGRSVVSLTFDTVVRLTEYEYGSIKILGYSTELYSFIHTYTCRCLRGKETEELLSSL